MPSTCRPSRAPAHQAVRDGQRLLPRLGLAVTFLERLSGEFLQPLPVAFGQFAHRSGFVAGRSAKHLAPFRQLKAIVRETTLRHPD